MPYKRKSNMLKCRLIKQTYKVIRYCYDDENGEFKCVNDMTTKYSLDDDIRTVGLEIEDLSKRYGVKVKGWSLFPMFNTESGRPEPGDMWWQDYSNMGKFMWDNEEGRHLHVCLPNGIHWDIDSRAKNCTMPDEKTHRCWVREGEPPNITVGKGGHTCSAGAGSIQAGDYHGFLRNGYLT